MATRILFCILACVALGKGQIIRSPPITNWGDWGDMELCPNGSVAQGFQLKTEPYRGIFVDDTALNAVRIFCGNPLDPNTKQITSSQGSWGVWGNTYACGLNGVITGFQLRVEQPGIAKDETATNNVRFLCSNMNGTDHLVEGDGLTFGLWRGIVQCDEGNVVCGIQTQIQKDRGPILDDTAMNNLAAQCCPMPKL